MAVTIFWKKFGAWCSGGAIFPNFSLYSEVVYGKKSAKRFILGSWWAAKWKRIAFLNMSDKLFEIKDPCNQRKCVICRTSEVDELNLGKLYNCEGVVCHYFCILLSSRSVQNGKDDEGIYGFLPKDIKKEALRSAKLTCVYCKKKGASLTCVIDSCGKNFHLPCGSKHKSLHLFYGDYKSYCSYHRPKQKVLQNVCSVSGTATCVACQENVTPSVSSSTLWAPCCKRNWFHRTCIQKMALNAGYFFKCPICNDNKMFRIEMQKQGIFVPDQDASWEMEPHAFEDLLYRHNSCDAEICKCPRGRDYSRPKSCWEVMRCTSCGSQGIHVSCSKLKWKKFKWQCDTCSPKKGSPAKPKTVASKKTESCKPSTSRMLRTRDSSHTTAPGPGLGKRKTQNESDSGRKKIRGDAPSGQGRMLHSSTRGSREIPGSGSHVIRNINVCIPKLSITLDKDNGNSYIVHSESSDRNLGSNSVQCDNSDRIRETSTERNKTSDDNDVIVIEQDTEVICLVDEENSGDGTNTQDRRRSEMIPVDKTRNGDAIRNSDGKKPSDRKGGDSTAGINSDIISIDGADDDDDDVEFVGAEVASSGMAPGPSASRTGTSNSKTHSTKTPVDHVTKKRHKSVGGPLKHPRSAPNSLNAEIGSVRSKSMDKSSRCLNDVDVVCINSEEHTDPTDLQTSDQRNRLQTLSSVPSTTEPPQEDLSRSVPKPFAPPQPITHPTGNTDVSAFSACTVMSTKNVKERVVLEGGSKLKITAIHTVSISSSFSQQSDAAHNLLQISPQVPEQCNVQSDDQHLNIVVTEFINESHSETSCRDTGRESVSTPAQEDVIILD